MLAIRHQLTNILDTSAGVPEIHTLGQNQSDLVSPLRVGGLRTRTVEYTW